MPEVAWATEEPPSRASAGASAELQRELGALFERWNAAIGSGDGDAVAALYAADAVLLPTLSNRIRRDPEAIASYFRKFVKWQPQARVLEGEFRRIGDVALYSGCYRFSFGHGPLREADARFTFAYARRGGGWVIVEHHSSLVPEVERLKPSKES